MYNKIHEISYLLDGIIVWLRNNSTTKIPKKELERAMIILEQLVQQEELSEEENEKLISFKYPKVNYQIEIMKLEEKTERLKKENSELQERVSLLKMQISYKKERLINDVKSLKSKLKFFESDKFKLYKVIFDK
jgi:hypothetical protein